MRLIDADKLKAIIIEEYRKEFFGSVLWNILDDVPTVTKSDICRDFVKLCKMKYQQVKSRDLEGYISIDSIIDDVLAEMEKEQ